MGTLTFDEVLLYTGLLSSVVYDFVICSSGKADIFPSEITQLPRFVDGNAELKAAIIERAARLVCVTESYTALWEQVLRIPWSEDSPARKAVHRRSLLVELDVLAAMALNVTIDELLVLYRTQFPVLRKYEESDLYDVNGREIPNHIAREYRKHGEDLSVDEHRWIHPQSNVEYTFDFPFRTLDREQDYRDAWAKFQKEFAVTEKSQDLV